MITSKKNFRHLSSYLSWLYCDTFKFRHCISYLTLFKVSYSSLSYFLKIFSCRLIVCYVGSENLLIIIFKSLILYDLSFVSLYIHFFIDLDF